MINSRVVLEGGKNLVLQVDGHLEDQADPWKEIFDFQSLRVVPKTIHIVSAAWLVQEKGTIILWWDKDNLLFPMESRNKADFLHPIYSPKTKWSQKFYISWLNCPVRKYFTFQINMDRQ
jgi:hypothetical protein